jgi:NAD+ kinase
MLIGIIGNTRKPDLVAALHTLIAILRRRDLPYLIQDDLAEFVRGMDEETRLVGAGDIRERASVVIAFGGDGTMLAAGRMLAGSGVPLIGVNLGKLGFLAEFSIDMLDSTLDELMTGSLHIVERSLLVASFPDNPDQESMIGLNDIVIDKRGGPLMLMLETYINGDYLGAFNADGLILSTPTGSTAYALAVGGPVVAPNAQVTVIAPIAPHMLTARPVVVPDTAVIEVYPTSHTMGEMVHVYADGQLHRNIPMPTRVIITRHEHTVCLVKRASTTYFDVLRAKLLWGREPILNIHGATPGDTF